MLRGWFFYIFGELFFKLCLDFIEIVYTFLLCMPLPVLLLPVNKVLDNCIETWMHICTPEFLHWGKLLTSVQQYVRTR